MRVEFDPENIRFTSDCVGFDAFRTVVREMPDEHEAGSGRRGMPSFIFACRPVREKGRTLLTFAEEPETALTMNRISSVIPPNKPFVLNWHQSAGRVGQFQVHPLFFEEVLRRAGIPAGGFRSVPSPRFLINRRVEWLCQLLMQETEQGCPSGRLYFEHLATALLVAVLLQTDPRLPDGGNVEAQQRRIQRVVALLEANFASKLSRDELAHAAGLSPSHFSQLFHSVVGLSPHQYLLRCRLRHAQKLLSTVEGGLSIAAVAAESGFADQAHLARHFRRAYGISPLQFRRSYG
jgi:AraC-like DNA-binding protein